jgi:hypothetical protein
MQDGMPPIVCTTDGTTALAHDHSASHGPSGYQLALTVPAAVVKAAVFPVDDVEGLVTAINAANTNGESNEIVLKPGTYTLRAPNNNIDGPNGLPSITGVITISTGTVEGTNPPIVERSTESRAIIERSTASTVLPFRIFHVSSRGALGLINVIVTGGRRVPQGGGLFNRGRIVLITGIPHIKGLVPHRGTYVS